MTHTHTPTEVLDLFGDPFDPPRHICQDTSCLQDVDDFGDELYPPSTDRWLDSGWLDRATYAIGVTAAWLIAIVALLFPGPAGNVQALVPFLVCVAGFWAFVKTTDDQHDEDPADAV